MIIDPIFSRTRYEYTSYSDFWRLVELSGFRTCFVDEIDLDKDEVYITTPVNGETRPHIHHRRSSLRSAQRARIVVWLLERPNTDDINGGVKELSQYVDAVWISDAWMARRSREISEAEGGPHYIFAELGSHRDLALGPPGTTRYDIAHLSYVVPRRELIYKSLEAFSCRIAPNAWGEDRDSVLRSTAAMLNVHQDEKLICEPLRVAVAAAYKLAYYTENCMDLFPLEHGQTCVAASYKDLVQTFLRCKSGIPDLKALGERLHQRLCIDSNFRKGVEEALSRTFE